MFSHHKQQTVTAPTTARTEVRTCNSYDSLASLGVVHPVQNDLWCPVPTGHHVARHLSISTASQAKVQDLIQKQTGRCTIHSRHTVNSLFNKRVLWLHARYIHVVQYVQILQHCSVLMFSTVIFQSTNLQFTVLVYSQVSGLKIL